MSVRYAVVATRVRWHMGRTLFAPGQVVEIVNTTRGRSWLVMGKDPAGHDRVSWINPEALIPDPHPHLTMEEA